MAYIDDVLYTMHIVKVSLYHDNVGYSYKSFNVNRRVVNMY